MEWPGLWNNACTLGPHRYFMIFCLGESNSITHQPCGANRWEAHPKPLAALLVDFGVHSWIPCMNETKKLDQREQSWKVAIHLIEEANIPKIILEMNVYHDILSPHNSSVSTHALLRWLKQFTSWFVNGILQAAVSRALRCLGFQTLTDVQQNLTFLTSQLTSWPASHKFKLKVTLFVAQLRRSLAPSCSVSPFGSVPSLRWESAARTCAWRSLTAGKCYEGSWMISDWKKQFLQYCSCFLMSKSENTDDTCDGFEDYIDIVLYCERCIICFCCVYNFMFHIVNKDWRRSFCECAHSATGLLD